MERTFAMLIPPLTDIHQKTADLVNAGHLHVHFSQWGEDVVLWHYFRQKQAGFYVDIGAHHPHHLSNTALLHHYNGWTGINVEPDGRLFENFLRLRPKDINVCCGVGAENGIQKFAVFEDGAVSSFDLAAVKIQIERAGKKLSEWREVPVQTLRDLLQQHLPDGRRIDLLNIDCEGWDLAVLKSNDWERFTPEFILVEDHSMFLPRITENETFRFLASRNYRIISQILATSIYKREP